MTKENITKENIDELIDFIKDEIDIECCTVYNFPSRVTKIYDFGKARIFDCDGEYSHTINLGKFILYSEENQRYFAYSLTLDNGQDFIYSSPVFIDCFASPDISIDTEINKLADSLETFLKLNSQKQEVNE